MNKNFLYEILSFNNLCKTKKGQLIGWDGVGGLLVFNVSPVPWIWVMGNWVNKNKVLKASYFSNPADFLKCLYRIRAF